MGFKKDFRIHLLRLLSIVTLTFVLTLYTNCGQIQTMVSSTGTSQQDGAYTWTVGDWGSCSATGCGTMGTQTRPVQCIDENSNVVNDVNCTGPRPADSQPCTSNVCSACTLSATLGGGQIPHQGTVTAFQASSVPFGQACQSEVRTCNNGVLSGSYQYSSCTVQGSTTNPCTLDGVTVNHGQSRVFYNSSSVACGQTCQSQTRTCNNGVFSGDNSYNRANCSAAVCASCNRPWGGTITHGASLTAYQAASVPAGQTCQSQTRTCNNGVLSGSYLHETCTVQNPNPTGSVSFAFDQYLNGDSNARYFSLMMHDFNRDGHQDIIFTDHNDGRYNRYWRGNGAGGFTSLDPNTYGAGQSSPERGSLWTFMIDFDFDGDMDWFWDDVSPASLRINNGSGTFTSRYAATNHGRVVGFSRYQNQSVMAVLTTSGRIISGQAILDGSFSNLPSNSPHILGQAACAAPVAFNGTPVCRADLGISESLDAVRMQSTAYVDLDNDGDNDLVFFYGEPWTSGNVRVYRNNGGGSYTNMGTLPNSTMVGSFINYAVIKAADFNNDGLMDLIVPGTSGGYRVYINNGNFSFTNAVTFNDDPQYNSHWGEPAVAVGDYNGDGKVDIALINGARVKLYRNTSN